MAEDEERFYLDRRGAERLGRMFARDKRRPHKHGIPGHVRPVGLGLRRQRRAVGPATGIGAVEADGTPGTGSVTFKKWDGSKVSAGTQTATAHNDWPGAVPASAELVVEQVYGTGEWFIVGWWCP